jgi:lipopolysaccharide/colanic/teichoic acid biosynthesis glycosyltransferase
MWYVARLQKINFNDIEWIIPSEEFPKTGLRKSILSKEFPYLLKTAIDIVFSVVLLVCLIPIFIFVGILIKFSSKGPVFFKQERIGFDGKTFKILKFRTMVRDAEDLKKRLMKFNEVSGPVFKIKKDPRITKIGGILRRTGLDELPQFWNVVRGHMSIIGPRPPLESEVRQYEKWQMRRLSVKPGITCTWQVEPNRHDISFEEWMYLDLEYIDNWSNKKDLKLFFKTIKTVFTAGGH